MDNLTRRIRHDNSAGGRNPKKSSRANVDSFCAPAWSGEAQEFDFELERVADVRRATSAVRRSQCFVQTLVAALAPQIEQNDAPAATMCPLGHEVPFSFGTTAWDATEDLASENGSVGKPFFLG